MRNTIIISILTFLFYGPFISLSVCDEQANGRDDIALEIMTIEVMVEQLEKMPQVTEDDKNARAQLSMDIHEEWFYNIITYETRDNLNLWKLVGRWATAMGVSGGSSYANAPFFHIQRLQPDYQKDKELFRLMAKLNAIRIKEHEDLVTDGYHNFVYLFEECDTNDAKIQLQIGRAYKEGYGLWRNYTEFAKWCKRSATAGNADALGELGIAYIYGDLYGFEEDKEIGMKFLNEAVAKGSASAAYELGRLGDKKKAIEMFRIAAEKGYYKAFAQLAEEYVKVDNGTEALRWANGGDEPNAVSDEVKHMSWEFKRSMADVGGVCSYIKGEVYALGIGEIEQDLAQAKELFEESYRKGSSRGAQAIAAMYWEGIGVETNANLAEQWTNNAAKAFSFAPRDFHVRQIKAFAKKLREASTR